MATPVLASSKTVQANLLYSDIKITLDGQEITPTDVNGVSTEPFTIDGTTYLPVRAISEALGYEVYWDADNNTAVINTDKVYSYPNKYLWYQEGLKKPNGAADCGWDLNTFINSELGEWYITQNQYQNLGSTTDEMNPAVLAHWEEIGMKKELFHADETDAAKYSVFTPLDMDTSKTYPVLFVNHGGNGVPYQAEWYGYVEEAAQRGWIVVCPHWELPALKDAANAAGMTQEAYIFKMTYDEVVANYPVDVTRVYVAGISGGGNAAGYMVQQWPELIAAVMPATGAAIQGSGVAGGDDTADPLAKVKQYGGIGLMMGYGLCDTEHRWPISDALTEMGKSVPKTVEERLDTLNDWVLSSGATQSAVTSMEELTAYQQAYATAYTETGTKSASILFGMNFDNEYTKQLNGFTYYFGDSYNENGDVVVHFMGVPMTGHFYSKGWAVEVMDFFEHYSRDPETQMLVIHS
jgi:acetyl esterase/lipase